MKALVAMMMVLGSVQFAHAANMGDPKMSKTGVQQGYHMLPCGRLAPNTIADSAQTSDGDASLSARSTFNSNVRSK